MQLENFVQWRILSDDYEQGTLFSCGDSLTKVSLYDESIVFNSTHYNDKKGDFTIEITVMPIGKLRELNRVLKENGIDIE